MFYSRENGLHDVTGDDAYRSWLISRNQSPIVYHSGDMHWKRLLVQLRRAAAHVRGIFAAVRVALVADKMRRARRELAQHGIRVTTVSRGPRRIT